MQLPFDFHALEEDLPKIAATSILIPILQWAVTQSWNYSRKARISALRKNISELNDFISKQKPYASDPEVDQSIQVAQEERSRIIKRLNNSCDPQHAERRTLAAILLFDKPRNFQVLFARVTVYIVLIAILHDSYEQYEHHRRHFDISATVASILIFLPLHYVARRANTITGQRNKRRWWQSLTLLYRKPLLIGGIFQSIFLGVGGLMTLGALGTIGRGERLEYDSQFKLSFVLLGFYCWLMARYFDRKPVNTTTENPQVPRSTISANISQ